MSCIGRVRRMGNWAMAIMFIHDKDKLAAMKLEEFLSTNKQEVPSNLSR